MRGAADEEPDPEVADPAKPARTYGARSREGIPAEYVSLIR